MKYNVWLDREDGTPSPAGPSPVYASGIVAAQRRAAEVLRECQAAGALIGWSIRTVTET
jgi:hypothetical protein